MVITGAAITEVNIFNLSDRNSAETLPTKKAAEILNTLALTHIRIPPR
jgi:hypothetical protein